MRMGLLLIGCALFATSTHAAAALRDGDIIFHTSRSAQSAAIQRATHSPYSHVGIVIHRDGKPYVFEANATVRYTPLADWIARGDGGRYVVKRLAGGLTAEQAAQLRAAARHTAGAARVRPVGPGGEVEDARALWQPRTAGRAGDLTRGAICVATADYRRESVNPDWKTVRNFPNIRTLQ